LGGGDGADPQGTLTTGKKGALYGTTNAGGTGTCTFQIFGEQGCGTVVMPMPPAEGQTAWTEQIVWSFTGGSDGGNSFAGLVADNSGALYGTTVFGGDPNCFFGSGCGVVFRLTGTGYVP